MRQAANYTPEPVISRRDRDGTIIESVLRPELGESRLVVCRDGVIAEHTSVTVNNHEYVPYSANNNLLTHRVIILPSCVGQYASEAELLVDLQQFIHRYVDLTSAFEEIAAHYVLLSWVYDMFSEVPYLRVKGDYGSGKSRFLLTVGALCFKPIFASGASTVSPLFRLIDQVGGTLVVDEADFWASDERAEIVKILNNGSARGFPVLRSEVTPQKEFNPRAFNIFGPKLVATRHHFEDVALESRCLTEVMGTRPLRNDIPITLPKQFEYEADALRNKLLAYRLHRLSAVLDERLSPIDDSLSPRRAQLILPLLAVAASDDAKARILTFVGTKSESSQTRQRETERRVLASARKLLGRAEPLTLGALAGQFDADWKTIYGAEVAPRWIGSILRPLGIEPVKSNGVYAIPTSDYPHLRKLCFEFGLGDLGDIGDEKEPSP